MLKNTWKCVIIYRVIRMEHYLVKDMLNFIHKSPTSFHAVENMKDILIKEGYHQLHEEKRWELAAGGKYFVIRNQSSIVAFHIGSNLSEYSFQIAAAHSDSPCFKVKQHALLEIKEAYTQLNTEGYGGMLCSSWLDRPLSLAGRVLVKEGQRLVSRLLDFDRDLLLIPNLAIHMNRRANEGVAYNKQIDLLPLFSGTRMNESDYLQMLGDELHVSKDAIYGTDLFLYNRMAPCIWGANREFLSSPRIDNLECAYTVFQGFLQGTHPETIQVYVCFDNEEVGSLTKQGAASTFLADVLQRINDGLGKTKEDYYRALANGFMVSADNAHALAPNHPEKYDARNFVLMNEGIVLKSNAAQHYTSDAVSIAIFKEICENVQVKTQAFVNRSDEAGGGTLGNLSQAQVAMNTIDIGLAQLAMHSAYETAGVHDVEPMIKAMKEFYDTRIKVIDSTEYEVIK